MAFRPPKGVRPPQLEGRRTGRKKGGKNGAKAWRDFWWAYEHRFFGRNLVTPPTAGAGVWHMYMHDNRRHVERWLKWKLKKGRKAGDVFEDEDEFEEEDDEDEDF